jgi:hypothetical protein
MMLRLCRNINLKRSGGKLRASLKAISGIFQGASGVQPVCDAGICWRDGRRAVPYFGLGKQMGADDASPSSPNGRDARFPCGLQLWGMRPKGADGLRGGRWGKFFKEIALPIGVLCFVSLLKDENHWN